MKAFEQKKDQLISKKAFYKRQLLFFFYAFSLLFFSLLIGVLGYKYIAHLNWMDALLNASMLLGGMGPVNPLISNSAKLFASFYAIYSGLIAIASFSLLAAPLFHRFFHHFHLIED
jgi:hypothetical protein